MTTAHTIANLLKDAGYPFTSVQEGDDEVDGHIELACSDKISIQVATFHSYGNAVTLEIDDVTFRTYPARRTLKGLIEDIEHAKKTLTKKPRRKAVRA